MQNITSNETINPYWTSHAMLRKQQRGIKSNEVDIVFFNGDREMPAGSNCYHLTISKNRLKLLVSEETICPKIAEKCKNLVVLTDGQNIITTFRKS